MGKHCDLTSEGAETLEWGGQHAVWTIPKIAGQHPTEKPLRLLQTWVRQFSEMGEMIFDPYAGTGTTGVAAMQLGRRFIGAEIDTRYFDIGCHRLTETYRQLALFGPSATTPPPTQTVLWAREDQP
mgnify:CR=1 FL=1